METNDTTNTEYQPRDYTLERWIVLLLSLLFLLPFVAEAQQTTTLEKDDRAGLLLQTSTPGVYVVSPEVKSEVNIAVTGPIVRTDVKQTFHNSTGHCVEGLYVYPLPEISAVDTLKMTIGSRVIVGEIHEREQARKEFETAKSEGRKAALVEQQRPNVFTTSVSGVMPDEDVVIEIAYQEMVPFELGQYRLRFPMVVAPRYSPQPAFPSVVAVKMPSCCTNQGGPVTLSVDLQPGYSVRNIQSVQKIRTETVGNRHYRVTADSTTLNADHDFELTWHPDLGTEPEATVLTEKLGEETYALVMVTPPGRSPVRLPRESIFIIDSSGSMAGASINQAKAALLVALDDLRPGDTFNVIDFASEARPLFSDSHSADPASIAEAKSFVDKITADGGTEMLKALSIALPEKTTTPAGTVRQVIFMTDGQVDNEQELFTFIHSRLGESRLFTVGIGAAPNSHFMRTAARFGRGTFTYIGDVQQVQERMSELFGKLDAPVMTSIDVHSSDATAESWPERVPDLYSGEPLVVAVRVHDTSAKVTLHGSIGNESWSKELTLPAPGTSESIARLWGREKIESLTDHLGDGSDPKGVEAAVIAVALQHHLVSQYTSLIAVDHTPQGLNATCVAELLPSGNPAQEDAAGTLPQTATPAALLMMIGMSLAGVALIAMRMIR
ncbi:MAG TPA: marine proteobacterial sortase target protein [Thermoanaerobaculia bacterium]|jgi:Ca-activated chloride channel family protein|nr:marine proteobacterial sortase target protein [Thermoanaerobaculia bacterium]